MDAQDHTYFLEYCRLEIAHTALVGMKLTGHPKPTHELFNQLGRNRFCLLIWDGIGFHPLCPIVPHYQYVCITSVGFNKGPIAYQLQFSPPPTRYCSKGARCFLGVPFFWAQGTHSCLRYGLTSALISTQLYLSLTLGMVFSLHKWPAVLDECKMSRSCLLSERERINSYLNSLPSSLTQRFTRTPYLTAIMSH